MERFSRNREAILGCLRGTDTHPTAEWVYAQLKPDNPSLSLGTVYRNLCQLKDAGVIISVGVVAGHERFDGDISDHAHVICTRCGCIADIPISSDILSAFQFADAASGFRITAAKFAGICPRCQSSSSKEGKEKKDGSENDV